MKKQYTVQVPDVSLRQWIKNMFPWITYERLQQAIREGDIKVNSQKVLPQNPLNLGDNVSLWDKLTRNNIELKEIPSKYWKNIILVDKNPEFWVIDKPYGVPTQRGNNIQVSIVEIMESWMETKPYLVHRLDRQTTGLLVIGTNSFAARELGRSLKAQTWKKTYIATVEGVVTKSGVMEADVDGKEAITKYKPMGVSEGRTKLRLEPLTGRKHQLRQHCARFLYPIVGDERYGSNSRERMQLRCVQLEFEFKGKKCRYEVPQKV
jgi:23S rRNA pseudouridine955/2504/2580 synthase